MVDGFNNWKKVKDGKACAFLGHIGKDNVSSPRRNAKKACKDLMNQPQHILRRFHNFNAEQIAANRLRLKAHIDVVRLLALQGIPFRGHDERTCSSNRGNFLEFLDLITAHNDKLSKAIATAPKNAKYTSHDIQKQILHLLSVTVKNAIREEIGVAKYCIIVDEARDESNRKQMSIVLRFVDTNGLIQERFFGLFQVSDTTAMTLKGVIYSALAHYSLDVQNIRGQGYDGASNMMREFDGLQALISKDCRSAYYVHCFAHRLQLALVSASKRAHADDIAHLIAINELETGRGLTQIGTLQRAADTRWSSHLRSLTGLIKMFSASCTILLKVMEDVLPSQRAEATSVYDEMTSCLSYIL